MHARREPELSALQYEILEAVATGAALAEVADTLWGRPTASTRRPAFPHGHL